MRTTHIPRIGPRTAPCSAPGNPLLTALESYFEQIIGAPARTAHEARLRTAARRLSRLVAWHEIEVLTDPDHTPGAQRANQLWRELTRLGSTDAQPSERLLARGVLANLADHERALLASLWEDAEPPLV